jgi:hypothetical protein
VLIAFIKRVFLGTPKENTSDMIKKGRAYWLKERKNL